MTLRFFRFGKWRNSAVIFVAAVGDAVICDDVFNHQIVDAIAQVVDAAGRNDVRLHFHNGIGVGKRRLALVFQDHEDLAVVSTHADRNAACRAPKCAREVGRAGHQVRRAHDAREVAPGIDDLAFDLNNLAGLGRLGRAAERQRADGCSQYECCETRAYINKQGPREASVGSDSVNSIA